MNQQILKVIKEKRINFGNHMKKMFDGTPEIMEYLDEAESLTDTQLYNKIFLFVGMKNQKDLLLQVLCVKFKCSIFDIEKEDIKTFYRYIDMFSKLF